MLLEEPLGKGKSWGAETEQGTSEVSEEEGGEARGWGVVLRSPEDEDEDESGTTPALRVWKDGDTPNSSPKTTDHKKANQMPPSATLFPTSLCSLSGWRPEPAHRPLGNRPLLL